MDARAIGSVQEAELLQRVPPRDGVPPGAGDDFGVRAVPPAWFTGGPPTDPSAGPSSSASAPTTFVETYVSMVVEPEAAAAADLYDLRHAGPDDGGKDDVVDDHDDDDVDDVDVAGGTAMTIHLLPLMQELASRRRPCLPPGSGRYVHVEDLLQCRRRPRSAGGLFAVLRALNGCPPAMVHPRQLALAVRREQAVAALPEGWGCDTGEDDCCQHLAWLLLRSVGVPKDVLPRQPAKQAFAAVKAAFVTVGKRLGWSRAPCCC